MCNFISWIEYENKEYYLTRQDLKTKEGKELVKQLKKEGYPSDIVGHGAILKYYSELQGKGKHLECENFSKPSNFPACIVNDIKKGNFENLGICLDILNEQGKKKYLKIKQPARAEYEKIKQSACAEYEKIKQSAWAEYEKIKQSACAEYEKIEQSAWAEYEKIKQPARAEYEKIEQSAFWKIAKQAKYRNRKWK